ncbi:MAG: hypothetical protein ACPG8W_01290 [Candidatus Promineifilaceae bacterium]
MKNRRFIGILAIFWGVLFLIPMLFGGMRARASARAEFAQSRFEAAQQAQTGDTTSETATPNNFRTHRHGHHHFGPFGLIGGLFKLFFLGFLFMMLMKMFKRRRHYWKRHHRGHRGEKSADDLTDDIRVGDEINRAEASAEPMPNLDEMTVDDLVMVMKRLGIKKLEL